MVSSSRMGGFIATLQLGESASPIGLAIFLFHHFFFF